MPVISKNWIHRNGMPTWGVQYYGPCDGQRIKDQGWRLYQARWHKTRSGQKVQRPRHKQKPRWALIGVFETKDEALAKIEELENQPANSYHLGI